jgi:hypothetical protein
MTWTVAPSGVEVGKRQKVSVGGKGGIMQSTREDSLPDFRSFDFAGIIPVVASEGLLVESPSHIR